MLGTDTGIVDGKTIPLRPNIGLLTQPISFIGLPVVAVPVWNIYPAGDANAGLPIGVQVIARPFDEQAALRVAAFLEKRAPVWSS